ncbi:VOC family protein [Emticicia sp. 17c]|uniref:VOC family protein n=1 Tax=Emticicia sp. 17c TaxID=3127704 RepID=UPI00301C9021
MTKISTYLNFAGKTEEAFRFYRSVFGGEFTWLQRFKDTPEGLTLSAEEQEKIMYIALPIGKTDTLMGTDALESQGFSLIQGNSQHIFVGTGSETEAKNLFEGLSAGGKITMPLEETFWGAYFGTCIDKFGINWMISYDFNQPA